MKSRPEIMNEFLNATDVIDWRDNRVLALAKELSDQSTDDLAIAKSVFEWVRDNVQHSVDYNRSELTCRASAALAARTGFCYAKTHLIAALMRANGIPTGFCYQRLSVDGSGPPYCLHGLNAVFLNDFGWYRIDARGNKEGICAAFTPPHESLAFSINHEGEVNLSGIWPAPLPVVVDALTIATSVEEFRRTLPDVAFLPAEQQSPDHANMASETPSMDGKS